MKAITVAQAKEVLPMMRAAVAAMHEVWGSCRRVERALGRNIDGLEGAVQDMATGVDNPDLVDADYVRDAINGALAEKGGEL